MVSGGAGLSRMFGSAIQSAGWKDGASGITWHHDPLPLGYAFQPKRKGRRCSIAHTAQSGNCKTSLCVFRGHWHDAPLDWLCCR
jgi:hypothetical protein